MQKMAPPPDAARIGTRYPRGATFNIVGSNHSADVDDRVSNNIENGTSAVRGVVLIGYRPPSRSWSTVGSSWR